MRALIFIMMIGIINACEKEEQYASAIINGIEYREVRSSNILRESPPSSITVWEDVSVAGYYTYLKPLLSGYPTFIINFYLSLNDKQKLEIGKTYKIVNVELPTEFNLISIVSSLKEVLPEGYDGIAFCQGINEIFSLEGDFEIEQYDTASGFYQGSYSLINPSQTNGSLTIKGIFKVTERKSQLIY